MTSVLCRLVLVGLLTILGGPSWAGLVSVDHPAFGIGALTYDNGQRLYWLRPSLTSGLSYIQTQALLAGDPAYADFRIATRAELEGLYAAALVPDVNVPGYGALYGTTANVDPVRALQGLVGVTYAVISGGVSITETAGYVGAPYVSPVNGFLSIDIGNLVLRPDIVTPNGVSSFASAYSRWGSVPLSSEVGGVGTWLVTDAPAAVPEPSTLLVVLIGLLWLTWVRPGAGRIFG